MFGGRLAICNDRTITRKVFSNPFSNVKPAVPSWGKARSTHSHYSNVLENL